MKLVLLSSMVLVLFLIPKLSVCSRGNATFINCPANKTYNGTFCTNSSMSSNASSPGWSVSPIIKCPANMTYNGIQCILPAQLNQTKRGASNNKCAFGKTLNGTHCRYIYGNTKFIQSNQL